MHYKKLASFFLIFLSITHLHAAQVKTAVQTEQDIFQLTLAAESGNIERLQALVEAGANIHVRDASGWNVLDWALYAEHYNMVIYLMKFSAKPACVEMHLKRALLRNNTILADFLMTDERIQITEAQIVNPFLICIKYFPEYLDSFTKSLLSRKLLKNNTQYSFFLKVGLAVKGNLIMLSLIYYNTRPDAVKRAINFLLKNGVDKNFRNEDCLSAYDFAKELHCDEVILTLLK